jgi:hypothetical protein
MDLLAPGKTRAEPDVMMQQQGSFYTSRWHEYERFLKIQAKKPQLSTIDAVFMFNFSVQNRRKLIHPFISLNH